MPAIEVYNSVGGAAFFERLQQEWQERGATVEAIQAMAEPAYRAERGFLGRLVRRWQMYPEYGYRCWRQAGRREPADVIRVVTTNPFFAPAAVARAAAGRGATIQHLYDLYPDALVQAGVLRPGSWLAARGAALTRYTLRRCDATVFLGERLRRHAEETYGPARRAAVIPVGADGRPFRDCAPRPVGATETLRILYSGLLGHMHDFQTVAAILQRGWPADVAWDFHTTGSGYHRLRRLAGDPAGVNWGLPLLELEWRQAMKRAQVALVTIAPGAERVVMPSKTYSALVAGQAVLAICRRESDLADLVVRHDCGWVVEPGDVEGLAGLLARIARDRDLLWAKRRRAFAIGHELYDMAPVAATWVRLFADLGKWNLSATPVAAETVTP
jgi:glycosyltransferase involved in cell wall biosynthesis